MRDTDNSRRHTVTHRIKIAINKLKYLEKLFWKPKGGMCMCWLEQNESVLARIGLKCAGWMKDERVLAGIG